MKRTKKLIAMLLTLCACFGCIASVESVPAAAASYAAGDGTYEVKNMENKYANGKYEIWQKINYKRDPSAWVDYGLTIKNQYLSNSAGKKVATWKDFYILKGGGTKEFKYAVNFSNLPTDTYTLHFPVCPEKSGGKNISFTRKIKHNAGKITYNSCKYYYDTNGTYLFKVTFSILQMKGYTPKIEIFDANGKKVWTDPVCARIKYDSTNYYTEWDFYKSDGNKAKSGYYTFKFTVNGKSGSKKLYVEVK